MEVRSIFVAWLVLLCAAAGLAAPPAATLETLIPADAGLCVQVDDLSGSVERVAASELFHRLQQFPPWQEWHRANGAALAQAPEQIGRQLGVSPADLLHKVFGRRLALAVWPADSLESKESPALLLVQAADAGLLQDVVDKLCEAQRLAGEVLESRQASYRGASYLVRTMRKKEGQSPVCLAVLGDVGVLTSSERILRQVIDLRDGVAGVGISGDDRYREAMSLLPSDTAARLYLNPRPWERLIEAAVARERQSPERDRRPVENLVEVWRAARFAAAALTIGDRLAINAQVEFEPAGMSPAVRDFLISRSAGGDFLAHVPADCVLAATGAVDLSRVLLLVLAGARPTKDGADRRDPPLPDGKLLLQQFFLGNGPHGGGAMWLKDSFAAGKGPGGGLPFDWLFGWQAEAKAAGGPSPGGVPVDRPQAIDPQAIKTASGGLVDMAVATSGYALLSNRPGGAAAAIQLGPERSLGASPRLRRILGTQDSVAGRGLYLDARAARRWIRDHRAALRAGAAGKGRDNPSQEHGLDQLLSVLDLADTLVAAVRLTDHSAAFTIGVTTEP